MGRLRRVQSKEFCYFITNRCFQRQFLLVPDLEGLLNKFTLDALQRVHKRYEVIIYGYVFMSNHFHLLVQAPHLNLSLFMRDFQSHLAKHINSIREGRTGPVFPERFSHETVGNDASLAASLGYILRNPVKAGLVEHPSEWPGLISIPSKMTEEGLKELPPFLSRLPSLEEKSWLEQFEGLELEKECAKFEHTSYKGAQAVCAIPWETRPKPSPPDPNPTPKKRRTIEDKVFCAGDPPKKEAIVQKIKTTNCNFIGSAHGFSAGLRAFLKRKKLFPEGTTPPVGVLCLGGVLPGNFGGGVGVKWCREFDL